jgi:pimeloyl-ACP methyl ester carboxylesterase
MDWLDGVLDGLGLPAAALGGHSYGGRIAVRYAIGRPGRGRRWRPVCVAEEAGRGRS